MHGGAITAECPRNLHILIYNGRNERAVSREKIVYVHKHTKIKRISTAVICLSSRKEVASRSINWRQWDRVEVTKQQQRELWHDMSKCHAVMLGILQSQLYIAFILMGGTLFVKSRMALY